MQKQSIVKQVPFSIAIQFRDVNGIVDPGRTKIYRSQFYSKVDAGSYSVYRANGKDSDIVVRIGESVDTINDYQDFCIVFDSMVPPAVSLENTDDAYGLCVQNLAAYSHHTVSWAGANEAAYLFLQCPLKGLTSVGPNRDAVASRWRCNVLGNPDILQCDFDVEEDAEDRFEEDSLPLAVSVNSSGEIVGISGRYVSSFCNHSEVDPFEVGVVPIATRASAVVDKMSVLTLTDPNFGLLATHDVAKKGDFESYMQSDDASVLSASYGRFEVPLSTVLEHQRLVSALIYAANANDGPENYVTQIFGGVALTRLRTFAAYNWAGMKELSEGVRNCKKSNRAQRDFLKKVVKLVMGELGFFGGVRGVSVLLAHFLAWSEMQLNLLQNVAASCWTWPDCDFSVIKRGNGHCEIRTYCSALEDLRRSRSDLIAPDHYGKFASAQSFWYGKPFTVIGKWMSVVSRLNKDAEVHAFGVGSENYWGSVLRGFKKVDYFDLDPHALRRFPFVTKCDIADASGGDVILSDVESDVSVRLFNILSRYSGGFAVKVVMGMEVVNTYSAIIRHCASKKMTYAVARTGDLYNGEVIFYGGPRFTIDRDHASPSLDCITEQVGRGMVSGEFNRRLCIRNFVFGLYPPKAFTGYHAHILRKVAYHRKVRSAKYYNSMFTTTTLSVKSVRPVSSGCVEALE